MEEGSGWRTAPPNRCPGGSKALFQLLEEVSSPPNGSLCASGIRIKRERWVGFLYTPKRKWKAPQSEANRFLHQFPPKSPATVCILCGWNPSPSAEWHFTTQRNPTIPGGSELTAAAPGYFSGRHSASKFTSLYSSHLFIAKTHLFMSKTLLFIFKTHLFIAQTHLFISWEQKQYLEISFLLVAIQQVQNHHCN